MAQIVFDPTLFREQFPQFADASVYPDACLQINWDMAICYISDVSNECLSGPCLTLLINLLTAHLTVISTAAQTGSDTGLIKSSQIDDVQITVEVPKLESQFQWWINQTPYGKQYYSLLETQSVGGFYIGGNFGLEAFRGPTGGFNA